MDTYFSHEGYIYNLHTCSTAEAKRMWKESIKREWDHRCAYCGATDKPLSLDHIVPQAKGGSNHVNNVLCACTSCNADKGHEDWIVWYIQQPFFTEERRERIEDWMNIEEEADRIIQKPSKQLYAYGGRKNRTY